MLINRALRHRILSPTEEGELLRAKLACCKSIVKDGDDRAAFSWWKNAFKFLKP
jgi:hypothetical protein